MGKTENKGNIKIAKLSKEVYTFIRIDDKGRDDESPYWRRTKNAPPPERKGEGGGFVRYYQDSGGYTCEIPGTYTGIEHFCAADQRRPANVVLSVDTDFTSGGIFQREKERNREREKRKRADTFDTIYKRSERWRGPGITK